MYATTIQLSEEIGMYVDELRAKFPGIDEVWLVGARIDSPGDRNAPWEFIVMADQRVLDALKAERRWRRDDVCLMIVTDGDRFETAWGPRRVGRLTEFGWDVSDSQSATYSNAFDNEPPVRSRRSAVRVR